MAACNVTAVPAGWEQVQLDVGGGGQTVDYREILKGPDGLRLRFRIHVDSYPTQSHCVAEVWNGTQWQEVCSRLPTQLETDYKLGYGQDRNYAPHFRADRDYLFRVAREVLDVA